MNFNIIPNADLIGADLRDADLRGTDLLRMLTDFIKNL